MEAREKDEVRARKKGKILVEIMSGPDDGRVTVCGKTPITIGRGSDETVHLPYDHLISRHHARIILDEEKIVLRDLNSTNGTFIGKKRIQEDTVIEPNTLFRVGGTQLMIRLRGVRERPD